MATAPCCIAGIIAIGNMALHYKGAGARKPGQGELY